jgi:hypothetical protein
MHSPADKTTLQGKSVIHFGRSTFSFGQVWPRFGFIMESFPDAMSMDTGDRATKYTNFGKWFRVCPPLLFGVAHMQLACICI